ncbi:MAG: hypothetical protein JRJ29_14745 [Deltaproteobacteria bacterium]|nr:hypothetical protein [Deltaproteobacteria bacterium]
MGLRGKTMSGFLILVTMLFLAGVWSVYELRTVGSGVQRLLDENYKSIQAARRMIEALERQDSGVLVLLLGDRKEGRAIINRADALFRDALEVAGGNITIRGESSYVNEIRSKYEAYKTLWSRSIAGTRLERDIDWYFKEVHAAFLEVKKSVQKLMAMNDSVMYDTASNLKNRSHRAVMPGVIAILSALVFSLVFNYFVNYYTVNPIIRMSKGIKEFISNRTPFDIKIESEDELRDLANSIKELSSMVGARD